LGHVHEGRINHRFAVRVIVTAGIAANLRALAVLPVWEQRQIVHGVENSALRGLEPITRIGQCARDDDRHRVIEERSRHFFGNVNWLYFFVLVIHKTIRQDLPDWQDDEDRHRASRRYCADICA
jgi:hypothetical protein